ncbi:AraC family transcriptional regulator [Prauserella marina]|uniref:Helix-turn-helix domain-containing protein n=1 Tax=Prauserella marina TaxID=530584 RepID=A0A222VWS0_9PSEU|nr:helix-turn-helix domain-containing protein [Prauserella marina]ASR38355.1 AraC family transcriptional regulator [Prauserella marina]PWV78428.1 AraC family transcriptional regulator [Prauserella marina]SDC85759.1 Helix-turn-helix domain-containing protein [Prauserella marina]
MERVPQGILNERLAEGRFDLSRHEPAESLRSFVQYYWLVRWDLHGKPDHEQRVLPNLSVHVSFSPAASGVWAPSEDVFSYRLSGKGHVLGVRFHPGCFRSFLAGPVSALPGKHVPLEAVFGEAGKATEAAILTNEDAGEMVALANSLLCTKARTPTSSELRAREAVSAIAVDPSITKVGQLSEATGLSVRSLQRLFTDCVGVSPKWAIQVYRLNEAAKRLAEEPGLHSASLAATLGYSDQAHFTRSFTAAIGTPPSAYGRNQI